VIAGEFEAIRMAAETGKAEASGSHKNPSGAENPIDAFTLRHLASWLDSHVSADERDEAREVIFEQLVRDRDATDRGLSWREIYDIGLRNRNRKPLDTSAAKYAKPARRKRSAKANPEPLPRLALLGAAVEIRTTKATLKPRGALLLVSEDGRQIVIARPASRQSIRQPSGAARARGMFEKWAGRKSVNAVRLSIPASSAAFDLGDVLAIRYRSDKWTGRAQLYEHKFEGKATAIADAPRAPRLIRVDGVPVRVLVTERGIVG
jgi:hypothetical protein